MQRTPMPTYGQSLSAQECVDIIGRALDGRRNAKGGFDLCRCPWCGTPHSLSVDAGENDKALIHCFAGCESRDVMTALRTEGFPLPDRPRSFSFAQKEEAERRRAAQQEEQARRHQQAAAQALSLWGWADRPVKHPYLRRKFPRPLHPRLYRASTIRQDHRGRLIVPLYDAGGAIVSVQCIHPDGTKRLLKDGRKRGAVHPIGVRPDELAALRSPRPYLLAEGWATAATLHLATGFPAIMTVDAGNMPEAARAIRRLAPTVHLVLCADEDPPGLEAARRAADAAGGKTARPAFSAPEALERRGYDFWDLWHERGPAAVLEAVLKALEETA